MEHAPGIWVEQEVALREVPPTSRARVRVPVHSVVRATKAAQGGRVPAGPGAVRAHRKAVPVRAALRVEVREVVRVAHHGVHHGVHRVVVDDAAKGD